MWRCKACHASNPPSAFYTVEGVPGLLCPQCSKRFTISKELVGQARCSECGVWSPQDDFRWVQTSHRGDGHFVCPKCKATPDAIENFDD